MFSANSSQVSDDKLFVEDCFSCFLYQGNGTGQTITNGIDLAGKGGMVWLKRRSHADSHILTDSARGFGSTAGRLSTDSTGTPSTLGTLDITALSSGFTLTGGGGSYNSSISTYASWTFRKAPKFFDVVTYTGDGNASQTISHNLGSEPGCIIIKRLNATSDWSVYHRGVSSPNSSVMALNTTAAKSTYGSVAIWNPTATTFTADRDYGNTNSGGGTYVAYLFAHDATSDGIIQCGSFTTDGSGNATVNLGWEPQWVMVKSSNLASTNWEIYDNMRGMNYSATSYLVANTSDAEGAGSSTAQPCAPTPTGFTTSGWWTGAGVNKNYIYIAIRRGPMKTPTLGTSVFAPVIVTGDNSGATGTLVTTNFPVDLSLNKYRNSANGTFSVDRLRGISSPVSGSGNPTLATSSTAAEYTSAEIGNGDSNTSVRIYGAPSTFNFVLWNFRRAPSFFDEVCYTGTGNYLTRVSHNLGVKPDLMIIKRRNSTGNWSVYSPLNDYAYTLNSNVAGGGPNGISSLVTATNFAPDYIPDAGGSSIYNISGATYVSYLFASCPGVSKVGSYTGNGTTQTIDCGFTAGARFVLIKRTDSTGDWYVWDTARGMTALTDPYLLMNSTAAETSTLGAVTTTSVGFSVNASVLAAINTSGASYIFLAIA